MAMCAFMYVCERTELCQLALEVHTAVFEVLATLFQIADENSDQSDSLVCVRVRIR